MLPQNIQAIAQPVASAKAILTLNTEETPEDN
jgi:hypothetical protein